MIPYFSFLKMKNRVTPNPIKNEQKKVLPLSPNIPVSNNQVPMNNVAKQIIITIKILLISSLASDKPLLCLA
jgi:hypothetical protein